MSGFRYLIWFGLPLLFFITQCQPVGPKPLFLLLDEEDTGIHFQNTITPNQDYNLLDFEYLYNGGGVGVGDFDKNGLPDLVFTGNMVESRVYLNKGNLQFEDITKQSGFDTQGKWCMGVSIIDINHDGYDDIYLCIGGAGKKSEFPNLLFINQGDLTFVESAAAYGLGDPNESNQALFFDYDLDGDLDMYLLNGGGFEKSAVTIRPILKNGTGRNTDKLYRNDFDSTLGHAVFVDVSLEANITIEGFGLGVGMIDANHDGWPDIYVSNDYLSRDLLYINQQNGRFEEAAEQYLNHMSHFSMGNDVGDMNNDGQLDLITLDMLPESHYRRKMMFGPSQRDRFYQAQRYGYGQQYMRNMLHVANNSEGFREIGQLAGIDRTDWSWAPLIADFDHDGFQDVYITNGYGKDITDLDFVKFRKDAIKPFVAPEEIQKILLNSLDDLPAIVLPNYAYKNKGDHTFENTVESWGFSQPSISNGAVYADLDLDGDLEIITNNIDRPAFIYKNTTRERDSSHFLQIKLIGGKMNRSGIGSIVRAYIGSKKLVRYQQTVKGFQSSVTDILHFGLGENTMIDSLSVIWPDGKRNVMFEVPANQLITINYHQAKLFEPAEKRPQKSLLTKSTILTHQHKETILTDDFKNQPLLIHGFSQQGPGMAVGDVNHDDLDDMFIGGAYGESASLYLQTKNGSFIEQKLPTEDYEDLGALFLDIDNDQDLDLLVTSGGAERFENHSNYQDRIYLNDGKGNFTKKDSLLPVMLTSTSTATAGDFDQDGDIDLFIGGRVIPGKFPVSPQSYLLRNTGGQFKDVTDEVCPELKHIGMVTSAIWTDFNNDHLQDLIVVGEMMKISIFQNDGKKLLNITEEAGFTSSTGMWNSITSGDFDLDGDMDYVVGNIGKNTPFEISREHPLQLHFADFDENGSVDPIYSIWEEDDYYPLASLDLLTQQLPEVKREILHYRTYAKSTTKDILNLLNEPQVQTLECEYQSSILLENQGDNRFSMIELPLAAQIAPVKGILVEDLNVDGLPDLIMVGNEYNTEVVSGQYDASYGTVLLNEGNMKFRVLASETSGFLTKGDTRSVVKLGMGRDQLLIVVGKNNGETEAYGFTNQADAHLLDFQANEFSALLEYTNGRKRKIERHLGSGYLSQQSGKFQPSPQISRITFLDSQGKQTRMIKMKEKV